MSRTLVTSLLLVPLALTAAAATSNSTNDASVSTEVSFPVIPAKIVHAPKVDLTSIRTQEFPNDAQVSLSLVVNTDGKARNVKVVSSDDPALNGPVLAALSKYHFRAATQGSQVVPYNLNLDFVVQRSAAQTLAVR
jgi:outer membrane biosynthesis protein TonB